MTQTKTQQTQTRKYYTAVVYEKGQVKRVVLYIGAKPLVFTTTDIKGVVRKRWKVGNTEAYSIRVSAADAAQLAAQNSKTQDDEVVHEQAIARALDQAIPAMIVTNKRVDLERIDRIASLANERGILPAYVDGSELRDLERALYMMLSKALYDFLVKARGVRWWPEDAGITELRQLSYVLEAAGLRVLLIIDNAHLAHDLGRLMDKIRELEEELQYAGVMLIFKDMNEEELEKAMEVLLQRGATRFSSIVLTDNEIVGV
jgi:hypothetical protein